MPFISIGQLDTDPCSDWRNWEAKRSTLDGRCYLVCKSDPSRKDEVDCQTALGIQQMVEGAAPVKSGAAPEYGKTYTTLIAVGLAALVGVLLVSGN